MRLYIDRQKPEALGVSFTTISDTLTGAMGSTYVNDFVNNGRVQQVIIQADAAARMNVDDVLKLYVRNAGGGIVALSEVVTPVWTTAPSARPMPPGRRCWNCGVTNSVAPRRSLQSLGRWLSAVELTALPHQRW